MRRGRGYGWHFFERSILYREYIFLYLPRYIDEWDDSALPRPSSPLPQPLLNTTWDLPYFVILVASSPFLSFSSSPSCLLFRILLGHAAADARARRVYRALRLSRSLPSSLSLSLSLSHSLSLSLSLPLSLISTQHHPCVAPALFCAIDHSFVLFWATFWPWWKLAKTVSIKRIFIATYDSLRPGLTFFQHLLPSLLFYLATPFAATGPRGACLLLLPTSTS